MINTSQRDAYSIRIPFCLHIWTKSIQIEKRNSLEWLVLFPPKTNEIGNFVNRILAVHPLLSRKPSRHIHWSFTQHIIKLNHIKNCIPYHTEHTLEYRIGISKMGNSHKTTNTVHSKRIYLAKRSDWEIQGSFLRSVVFLVGIHYSPLYVHFWYRLSISLPSIPRSSVVTMVRL